MPTEAPAIPVNPNNPAISAITKKVSINPNIISSSFYLSFVSAYKPEIDQSMPHVFKCGSFWLRFNSVQIAIVTVAALQNSGLKNPL
jgi:hypothetical protein